MPKAHHSAPKQTESKRETTTKAKQQTPENHEAAMLGLQQSVGNRAVQRMMSDAKTDSAVIQRHLAPGMGVAGATATTSLLTTASGIQSSAAKIQSAAAAIDNALITSSAHPATQSDSKEGISVPSVGGV